MKLLFLLLFLPSICVATQLNWIIVDYPPYYIIDGEHQGQGRDESIIELLTSKLDQRYRVKQHLMPASRAVKSIGTFKGLHCMVSLYRKKEREKYIYFTDQYATLGFSPGVAMRRSIINKLNIDHTKPVSLKQLIEKYKLTLGVTLNRSYGQAIDEIISQTQKRQIIVRAGRDALESLTVMLKKKRIDIILGYPSEHHYLKSIMDKNDELTQFAITEANTVSKGYIGCSKTPAGKEIIADLNSTLAALNKSNAFNDTMLRWLPEQLKPKLTPYLEQMAAQ